MENYFTPSPITHRPTPTPEDVKESPVVELETVYFDYNKSDLSEAAKKTIQKNVEWLKKNPDTSVQVEGHCDERGTRAYNFMLGERRANAVLKYMRALGLEESRMSVVSYGAIGGQSAKNYASSRRAISIIIYPSSSVSKAK